MSKIQDVLKRDQAFMEMWASHNPSHVAFATIEAAAEAIASGSVKFMAYEEKDDQVNIDMFGPFVADIDAAFYAWWYQTDQLITGDSLQKILAQYPDHKLNIRIKSPGGNAIVGSMVQDLLTERSGDIASMRVFGMVASAGTFAYLAAPKDKRKYGQLSHFLVHDASQFMFVYGRFRERDLSALLTDIKGNEQSAASINKAMAELYASDTGKSVREMRNLMEKEQWLVGDDIAKWGFALESGKMGKGDEDEKKLDKSEKYAQNYPIAAMVGVPMGTIETDNNGDKSQEANMSKELEARIKALEAKTGELETHNATLVAENAKLMADSEQSSLTASVAEHTAAMDAAIVKGKFTPALKASALEAIGKAETTEQLATAWAPWADMIKATAKNTFGNPAPKGDTPPTDPDETNQDDEVGKFIDAKVKAGMQKAEAIQRASQEFSPDAVFAYLKPLHLARQKEYMTH